MCTLAHYWRGHDISLSHRDHARVTHHSPLYGALKTEEEVFAWGLEQLIPIPSDDYKRLLA